jgi:hypothetical protein
MVVAAAFPFIEITIDTSALIPVAERVPGVIAIVGKTAAGASGGLAAPNRPTPVDTLGQAADLFARRNPNGTVAETPLYRSLMVALQQDPKPTKIYGVRVDGDDYAGALASLEAADDVTFVALAEEANAGNPAAGENPPTNLMALKAHVETVSADGGNRMGVAMVNPAIPKSPTYVADVSAAVAGLKSDSGRMIVVAARGGAGDAAVASMAAIAGYPPQASIVLKRVRGLTIPLESQYGPAEIKGLAEVGINAIIDPALILGEGLYFADGRTFSTDPALSFVDTRRVLDDIDFRLKAGLIGLVGDARITKAGMTRLKVRTEGILGPLQRSATIDDFGVGIPVLNILSVPENTWTATDAQIVATARANRAVDMLVSITYGPAVHRLLVRLAPKF